jgi:hypothetical protein
MTPDRRLQAENFNLRHTLDQARLHIELFRDRFRNLGEHDMAQNADEILLQIARILNPDYFMNAPSVSPDTNEKK